MSLQIDTNSTAMKIEFEDAPKAHENTPSSASEDDPGSISSEESGGLGNDTDYRVRGAKSVQEIWEEEVIWNSLQALPGTYELLDLINLENLEVLSEHRNAKDTGLMLASWLGNERMTRYLLELKANANTEDNCGRAPLHLAAGAGNEGCVKALIHYGANVQKWDSSRKATPLHCAASRGRLCCLKVLVKHGADVNAGMGNKSALHYAVQCNSVECVRELLKSGAIPNTTKIFSETPLHVAAALGSVEIIKLLLEHKAEVRVQCGEEKITALHLAAEDGNAESAKLLLDGGAQISATNKKQQTPLHFAALSQSSETLELLLNHGANPNAQDIDGRTPLHGAIVKVSRSCECVRLLIKFGADVNKPDAFGYTPLHLAALNEFSQCVLLLLSHGGDVTARTNGGISVLTFITRRTPDVIPRVIEKFDSSIKVNDHEIGDVDCELKLDFRILVPSTSRGETELLLNFIEVGHRELLKHPLCETFLFLKWRRIRKYFFVSLMYHLVFAMLFTYYTIGVFLRNCPSKKRTGLERVNCSVDFHIRIVGYVLLGLNVMLLVKELFQIAHSCRTYVKQWENWLQWTIIISVFCCVELENRNIQYNLYAWQHHVAAIGIFFTWLELMMIVGRFPIFGLYVQMFTTVSVNFAKFLMAYLCLLIAFALSFSVLLPNYPAFNNIAKSKLKVIMMMIGELEFEDIFYNNGVKTDYDFTAQIMFLAFVILVTIILMNLMVGLAVSDIQGLQQSAGLDRLVRQAELVAQLESMLFSKLLNWVPREIMFFLHRHALLLKSEYHWALYLKPNDPRETRIPKDLIRNIYDLVAERKPARKRRSERHKYYPANNNHPANNNYSTNNNFQSNQYSNLPSPTTQFPNVHPSNIPSNNHHPCNPQISNQPGNVPPNVSPNSNPYFQPSSIPSSNNYNSPPLSTINSFSSNTSLDNIDLNSAFRMRLCSLNHGVKSDYKNILMK